MKLVFIKTMKQLPQCCAECPLEVGCDACEGYENSCVMLGKETGYDDFVDLSRVDERWIKKTKKEAADRAIRRQSERLPDCPLGEIEV